MEAKAVWRPWYIFDYFLQQLARMPHLRYLAIKTPLLPFPLQHLEHSLPAQILHFPAWNSGNFTEFDDLAEDMRDNCVDVCPSLRRFYLYFGHWKDLHYKYSPFDVIEEDRAIHFDQFQYYFRNKGPRGMPVWVKEENKIQVNWYGVEGNAF